MSPMQGRFDGPSLQTACDILDVLGRYRSVLPSNVEDRSDEGNLKFLSIIYGQVRTQKPIRLVLPAFPFKSPNRNSKTLGSLPDKGEEISLAHLHGLCAAIEDVYTPGARLTIASDGLVYNGQYTLEFYSIGANIARPPWCSRPRGLGVWTSTARDGPREEIDKYYFRSSTRHPLHGKRDSS